MTKACHRWASKMLNVDFVKLFKWKWKLIGHAILPLVTILWEILISFHLIKMMNILHCNISFG